MCKQIFYLVLFASAHLFGQDCWCYMPEGQTIYSEVCCPNDLCPPECNLPCTPYPVMLIDVQGGVRRDSFSFSVQGPHGVPNRFLQQKYSKVKSAVGAVNVWFQVNETWYLRGYADYASISHATEKQTFNNSAGDLALRYRSHSNGGYLYDFLGGLGWILPCIPCIPENLTVAIVGGYSREGQCFKSHKAKLTTPAGDQGKVPGRHSKLQASWTGPWAGVDLAVRYGGLKVAGTFEYHWTQFRATEYQTAGGSCASNCHTTNKFHAPGQGLVGVLSFTRMFCQNWRFGFVGKGQWWRTKSGHYSLNGQKHRLNRVKWNSGSIVADLGYRF